MESSAKIKLALPTSEEASKPIVAFNTGDLDRDEQAAEVKRPTPPELTMIKEMSTESKKKQVKFFEKSDSGEGNQDSKDDESSTSIIDKMTQPLTSIEGGGS